MAISGNPNLSAWRLSEPEKAEGKIVAAVRQAKGNLSLAARKLKVSKRTLSRWLADDSRLAETCKKAGNNDGKEGKREQ